MNTRDLIFERGQQICAECGYTDYTRFANGRDACIAKFIFTFAILSDLTEWGYGDRWCYESVWDAMEALAAWDGEGEPQGWHRHPDTGRRREGGDPAKEEVRL
jgi:hypothetical protein